MNARAAETLYLTSVTLAGLLSGIAVLPKGRRKERLKEAVEGPMDLFEGRFSPSIPPPAGTGYAELAVRARTAGRSLSLPDGYIAAIAAAQGFKVASRVPAPFEAAAVEVIDPWKRED